MTEIEKRIWDSLSKPAQKIVMGMCSLTGSGARINDIYSNSGMEKPDFQKVWSELNQSGILQRGKWSFEKNGYELDEEGNRYRLKQEMKDEVFRILYGLK